MDISIIVCCYNSEKLLPQTLLHLGKQKCRKELNYEVVLVNNNSNDNTVKTARELWDSLHVNVPLIIVDEPTPGLAHARKKGVSVAKSDLIIFCDDDNWLDENYIELSIDFMNNHLDVGALGGQSEGVLEAQEPVWWKDKAYGYAVGKQSDKKGDITQNGFLWGAGIVIRKSILLRLFQSGFESLLLGRTENKLASGDDSEICKWVIIMGYKLWYLDDLKFKHYIVKKRLTDDYVLKMFEGHYDSRKVLGFYNEFIIFLNSRNIKINKNLLFEGILDFIKARIKPNEINRLIAQFKIGNKLKVHSIGYEIFRVYTNLKETKSQRIK
ncbi:glycosyltransferase [Formosa sp. PL04]|uniref:glycosyltransferase n=1 Tax=Formosa sp. PL04 TaxID=3081755 RepID=UPI002981E8AF|nr:glycosyltransferase [Formosa sp. PL04]MDW5287884.1 glycosyltransferase [Formosa sp. PL04]